MSGHEARDAPEAAPTADAAVRAYRLLLRAYPAAFRAAYGGEMEQLFRDQLHDHHRAAAGGRGNARSAFWTAVLWDLARSAPGLRLDALRDALRNARRRAWRDGPRSGPHTRFGEGTMAAHTRARRAVAGLAVLGGTYEVANTGAEVWAGYGGPVAGWVLGIALAALMGLLLLAAGVLLFGRGPDGTRRSRGAALACLALVVGLQLVFPFMSIFARLLGIGIPVALLVVTRRPRGTDGGASAPAAAVACGLCVAAAACLPRARTNAACRWVGDTAGPARRAHLLEDVRVAQDLGVRYADAVVGRPPPSMARWDSARRVCVDAALAGSARRHGVPRAELAALTGARELWVDLLAVFLPMGAVFVAASRAVVGRLVAGYAPGERAGAAAVLALLAPFAAALALGVTQIWGTLVEMARLGNEHISSRGFELPANRHGWLVWGVGVGLFAAVAARSLARTPAAPHLRYRHTRGR